MKIRTASASMLRLLLQNVSIYGQDMRCRPAKKAAGLPMESAIHAAQMTLTKDALPALTNPFLLIRG